MKIKKRKRKTVDCQLWQGDCLELMHNIDDASIDMVMTDPPYGTTACKWDSVIPLDAMWAHLKRIIKPNGAIVLCSGQPFTTTLINSNIKLIKHNWIWNKNVGVNYFHIKKQPLKVCEDICVFFSKQPTYNPIKTIRKKSIKKSNNNVGEVAGYKIDESSKKYIGKVYDDAYPTTLINISSRDKYRGLHPTQKPVELMEYMIKTYTNEDELVLDFTMGSGTTGVACKNLNRRFIGIELDEKYFQIARDRINEHRIS